MRRPSPPTLLRLAAAGWLVPRVVRAAVGSWTRPVPSSTATDDGPADLTVVIPARDEADRIARLLVALGGRYDVIVVDDDSADGTAAVALAHGATVVRAGDRPDGWAGKTWALRRGVETANGEWVVHLDADVEVSAPMPDTAVAMAQRLGADVMSVATRVVAPPAARWLHASMLATLVYRLGGPGAILPGRELANGQALVARRSLLVGPDGWTAVAADVTEDVALARHVAANGRHVVMVDAGEVGGATVRFESFGDVLGGWGRSIGLTGIEPDWRSLAEVVALALAMSWPLVRLATRRGDALDVGLVAVRWGAAAGVARAYRPAGPAVWLSPLADPIAIASVARSATRRRVTWRGRTLQVPSPTRGRSADRRRP